MAGAKISRRTFLKTVAVSPLAGLFRAPAETRRPVSSAAGLVIPPGDTLKAAGGVMWIEHAIFTSDQFLPMVSKDSR